MLKGLTLLRQHGRLIIRKAETGLIKDVDDTIIKIMVLKIITILAMIVMILIISPTTTLQEVVFYFRLIKIFHKKCPICNNDIATV